MNFFQTFRQRFTLPWWFNSTFLIFVAIALGIVLGGSLPSNEHPFAYDLFAFCSKAFIALIKGLIVPLIFSTIIVGVAQAGDARAVGRMGFRALLYFEVVTTIALFLGLAIANFVRPGDGLPLDLSAAPQHLATPKTGWEIALHALPSNLIQHAAEGDILPVVVFATLFGLALLKLGERGKPLLQFFELTSETMFRYTDMIMKLTPIGVFGAMAYNVSKMAAGHLVDGNLVSGWPAVAELLAHYLRLVASLYLALVVLFVVVFIPVLWVCKVKVIDYLRGVKRPALTAFSTASSEAALPQLLEDIVKLGVPRRIAAFVLPTGYSFNLDGSTLYLVLASLTIAQAAHIELTFVQQVTMVFTFMLTSKGVAGVPRATLVIIAGTCASFGLPADAGIALLLAVDAVMDMARTTINVLGNGLACIVIARWEGAYKTETTDADADADADAA